MLQVQSITSTFVSQFGVKFEIKFFLVYRNRWLILIFQKEGRFPENQTFRKSFFFRQKHVTCIMILGLRSPYHLNIFVSENKTYQALATSVLKLCLLHSIRCQACYKAIHNTSHGRT